MENKDSQMIRNYMNLMESIENKLSTDKVIVENEEAQTINEFGRAWIKTFSGDAKALKSAEPALHAAFTDVLSIAKTDKNQIKGLTKMSPNKFVNITNVDDLLYALRTDRGMTNETLALFNQGLLKSAKTPTQIIEDIAKEVVKSDNFIKTYGGMTPKEMESALKSKGYSDNAVKSLMENAKKDKNFKTAYQKGVQKRKVKKTSTGKTKNLNTKTNGTTVPPGQKTTLTKRAQELLDGIKNKKWNWKKVLAWGAGIGVGAVALWWWFYDNAEIVPDDLPENEPTVNGDWAPCIQNLINNKSGVVSASPNGEISVSVAKTGNPEYDKAGGLQFYSNGRVMLRDGSKKGSWTCKEGKAVMTEQTVEVSDSVMQNYVDTAVDDLDGWVDAGNLSSLKGILKNLSGKTYRGQDAIKAFLKFYSNDEGGDSFIGDVQSVGTKTVGVAGISDKEEILRLASSKGAISKGGVPKIGGGGLSDINITWDSNKGEEPSPEPAPTPSPKKKSKYHQCSDFPLLPGCKSPMIKEVQYCLGMESKYQTGNFGPITAEKIQSWSKENNKPVFVGKFTDNPNATNVGAQVGISKETYDFIIKNCKGRKQIETDKKDELITKLEPIKPKEIKLTDVPPVAPAKINPITTTTDLPLTRENCEKLFIQILDRDKASGKRTATKDEIAKCKTCLQQYNFGIGKGAVRIKRGYSLTPSGGDKGIR